MSTHAHIGNTDTVYLSLPIWGQTVPLVIRAFLSACDVSGKPLIPFITQGGYAPGESQTMLAQLAPKGRLLQGFAMETEQERRTMGEANRWLGKWRGFAATRDQSR